MAKKQVATKGVPRKRKQPGLAPGTLVHVGEQRVSETTMTATLYNKDKLETIKVATAAEAKKTIRDAPVNWINVIGLHDTKAIEAFGKEFGLHPLLLEDVVNTEQRPKIEQYGDVTFIVIKAIHAHDGELIPEHLCIVLTKNYLITFQEREGDVFKPVYDRIEQGRKIRERHEDYLTYALIDSIVDHYYGTFEDIAEHIEILEEEVLRNPQTNTMQRIMALKREMIVLQKATWPVREVISALLRGDSPHIKEETQVYLRDVYDHSVQVMESVQTLRDIVSGIMDLYMSSVSNRMNEVMKVLTIIATIFIPLTFVAGVYGMNFEHMPELSWRYGYLGIWIIMLIMAGGLTMYFRKKNWL